MSNATGNIQLDGIGQDGRRFHVPVKTGTTIYEGTMVAQQIADGLLVAATAAGTWPALGKATHKIESATAGQRMVVETDRIYILANGTSTDAFSEASQLGSPAYAFDDHTVYDNSNGGTLLQCGTFEGMEPDGRVRVKMSTSFAAAANAAGGLAGGGSSIQSGRGTLVAGVLAVTGVTITATSRIFASRVTEAGTDGDELRIPDADRTVGALGTGAFSIRSFLSGTAATSDTSTVDWIVVG
jgi:hypothetical protein